MAVSEPPNVLLIVCDDLGYGDVGCYHAGGYPTPGIDALAARGVRFTDAHSTGVVCSPSRASLLTGRAPRRTGVTGVLTAAGHRDQGLDPGERTLAHVLGERGYATGCVGKWHLGYHRRYNPTRFGFDHFRGYVAGNVDYHSHVDQPGHKDWWLDDEIADEPGYVTDLITGHADRFIREHRDRPWFLYVAHEAPHYPYQGPDDPPERVEGEPAQAPHGRRADDPAAYREMIERLDAGVATLTATLDELGIADSTLVVFTSDHGAEGNAPGTGHNGPLAGAKATLYEGGHRVPTILCGPGVAPAGAVRGGLVSGMDVLPTICRATGAEIPGDRPIDGIDLRPWLGGEAGPADRSLAWQASWEGERQAIRHGRWKLIEPMAEGERPRELYDLEADPAETRDRSGEAPDVAAALRRRLAAINGAIDAGEPVPAAPPDLPA